MASTMDWSQLLLELLELILDQLTCLFDHLNFASVCSSWQLITSPNRCSRRLLPFLMLPPGNDSTEPRPFFNLLSCKINDLHIPKIHRKWCCGSSHGWLVTVDESTGEIQLFNPASEGIIQLPSIFTFSYPQHNFEPEFSSNKHYIHKAILSSNPFRTLDYVVVANFTNRKMLAYWKPGADRWTTIRSEKWVHFEDFIYHKGLLYVVSNNGPFVTYDFSSEPPIAREMTGRPPEGRTCDLYYLVESLGEPLLVLRHYNWLDLDYDDVDVVCFKTMKFQGLKLDERKRKWIQMESIGDCILFLGIATQFHTLPKNFQNARGTPSILMMITIMDPMNHHQVVTMTLGYSTLRVAV